MYVYTYIYDKYLYLVCVTLQELEDYISLLEFLFLCLLTTILYTYIQPYTFHTFIGRKLIEHHYIYICTPSHYKSN